MKKLLLAVMAVVMTACTTVVNVPNYRNLASKVVPTNVELIGNLYNLWTGESKENAAYCSGVAISHTKIITAGHCTAAARNIPLQAGVLMFDGKIKVRLQDGRVVLAKILMESFVEEGGSGAARDVALLEIETGSIRHMAVLGDSDTLEIGDQLAIVGNSGGILKHSFTIGVVSYLNRELDVGVFIQTDALALGGNSGGPVFDMDGKVVGILVRGGNGVSLALPINDVLKHIAEGLAKKNS
jgi:S1-C subfamily serine protease